jgi:hypothetical protein
VLCAEPLQAGRESTNLVAFGWDCLYIDLKGQFPFGGPTPEPIG